MKTMCDVTSILIYTPKKKKNIRIGEENQRYRRNYNIKLAAPCRPSCLFWIPFPIHFPEEQRHYGRRQSVALNFLLLIYNCPIHKNVGIGGRKKLSYEQEIQGFLKNVIPSSRSFSAFLFLFIFLLLVFIFSLNLLCLVIFGI